MQTDSKFPSFWEPYRTVIDYGGRPAKFDETGTAKYKIEFLFGGETPNGGTKHETIFSETQSPVFNGGIAIL
jgi:hypothetical protein